MIEGGRCNIKYRFSCNQLNAKLINQFVVVVLSSPFIYCYLLSLLPFLFIKFSFFLRFLLPIYIYSKNAGSMNTIISLLTLFFLDDFDPPSIACQLFL